MSTTLEALEERMARMEREMARLARMVGNAKPQGRPPADETLEEWLARHREDKSGYPSRAEYRRALGIPEDLEPMSVEAAREMMLAEGVRPEECILSREIIRMREE